eukprot:TRINITY_DN6015_c0_g1_i1.p1 TRINITY_DN6015_c0_g1~~TRINITY_DN6015_c0_g1_i1.p1  ORF type:complete len:310 (+),score=53.40 TRINITY_DN6015_c0_g1_i1:161-1090(+)
MARRRPIIDLCGLTWVFLLQVCVGQDANAQAKTAPDAVQSILPKVAVQGRATVITLEGAPENSLAVFVPSTFACKAATPAVTITGGKGNFTIAGDPGEYKLCLQAPNRRDSVEQVPAKGRVILKVIPAATTGTDAIESIIPNLVTVNVPTMLTFKGAKRGDKVRFVNANTSSCELGGEPNRLVPLQHGLFVFDKPGEYLLCYRVLGAVDSIQQQVTVRAKMPGVTRDMVYRWQSKNGTVDCAGLTQVANCGISRKEACPKTYQIVSGYGLRCSWDEAEFPGVCKADVSTTDASKVCKKNSCNGKPNQCW